MTRYEYEALLLYATFILYNVIFIISCSAELVCCCCCQSPCIDFHGGSGRARSCFSFSNLSRKKVGEGVPKMNYEMPFMLYTFHYIPARKEREAAYPASGFHAGTWKSKGTPSRLMLPNLTCATVQINCSFNKVFLCVYLCPGLGDVWCCRPVVVVIGVSACCMLLGTLRSHVKLQKIAEQQWVPEA